jgi:hypothetical protein
MSQIRTESQISIDEGSRRTAQPTAGASRVGGSPFGGSRSGEPGRDAEARSIAAALIEYLETGRAPDGLFTPDVFCDYTMPHWRLQAAGLADVLGLRSAGHPAPGRVPRWRFDATPGGFLLEVEETWEQGGEQWYCRELIRADVRDGAIAELAVYCTGDWDAARVAQHRAAVTLIRP